MAIVAYFGSYGPATVDAFGNWLAGGYFGKRLLRAWFGALGERLVEVDVGGERAHVLAEDSTNWARRPRRTAVRLLPGLTSTCWVPAPGDGRVVPTSRRADVSRQSGWISPVVVVGGVVRATWELEGDRVRVAWFEEAGRPPRNALRTEVTRLSSILDRDLRPEISIC